MCSETLLEMLFPLCAMNTVLNSCSVVVNALVERYVFLNLIPESDNRNENATILYIAEYVSQ